VSLKLSAKGGV